MNGRDTNYLLVSKNRSKTFIEPLKIVYNTFIAKYESNIL